MELVANSNKQSGFTLIEFCVAVLIMMVGLLGLLQAVNIANVHNLASLYRNEAISVADEQMVMARASVYDAASFTALTASSGLINRKLRGGFNNYSVNRTVTTTSVNSREIALRVTWRYKGNRQSHIITTLVANPNP